MRFAPTLAYKEPPKTWDEPKFFCVFTDLTKLNVGINRFHTKERNQSQKLVPDPHIHCPKKEDAII